MNDAYAAAGVDIRAGEEAVARYRELLARRSDPRILDGIGAFGGSFAFQGYADPVLVASTDGIGTKVLVAARLGRFDTVGRDLVNHCIDDVLCANAQPLFFLDYLAVEKLDPAMAAQVVSGIADACASSGVALLGGETAEMPGVYAPGVFDLAGTIVGAVERAEMIDINRVLPGDVVIGLPANGFHTNGYSLVRRVLDESRWSERLPGAMTTIGDALLAVHPSYLPYIRAVQGAGVSVKAMAHITGGGLLENLPRALPEGMTARIDRSRVQVPGVMAQVVREATLDDKTAYRTFNMGVGFCAIVASSDVQRAIAAANAALAALPIPHLKDGRAAQIGVIESRESGGPRVIIS